LQSNVLLARLEKIFEHDSNKIRKFLSNQDEFGTNEFGTNCAVDKNTKISVKTSVKICISADIQKAISTDNIGRSLLYTV